MKPQLGYTLRRDPTALAAEVARLQAEVDALRAEMERREPMTLERSQELLHRKWLASRAA